MRVVIPPQPRYLYNGCCADEGHSTNVLEEDHAARLLSNTIGLRTVMKKSLSSSLGRNFWLANTCGAISGSVDKPTPELLAALKNISARDGVHLTKEGYRNMARNLGETVANLASGKLGKNTLPGTNDAAISVSGARRFFWRGISSPVGSGSIRSAGPSRREKQHAHFAPYRRGGGGVGDRKNAEII